MKVAIVIPRRHNGRWVSREYKDGYYDLPHPPYLMLSIAALVRRELPEVEIEVIDAQLLNLDVDSLRRRVAEGGFDAALVSLGIISIKSDAPYTDLPCPTIGLMQAYLDKAFAIERYGLAADAYTDLEVEWTVVGFLRAVGDGRPLSEVAGVYLPEGDGAEFSGQVKRREMSDLPIPAFDLVDVGAYLDLQEAEHGTRYAYLFTTRGCPFGCYFCAAPDGISRRRSAKSAAGVFCEIRFLYNHAGVDRFYFMDDEFAADMDRAKDICRLIIAGDLDIRFVIYNHVQFMDEELAGLLSAAGCTFIRYGIETADAEIGRRMNKPLDVALAGRAFEMTRRAGLGIDAFFLLGFPGETGKTVSANLSLIKRLRPTRVTWGLVFPKPYSVMYRDYRERGLLVSDDWAELYPDRLTFAHDYWQSFDELRAAMLRLGVRAERALAWRQLWRGGGGFGLYTRLVRYLATLPVLGRVRGADNPLTRLLRRWYRRPSKLEI